MQHIKSANPPQLPGLDPIRKATAGRKQAVAARIKGGYGPSVGLWAVSERPVVYLVGSESSVSRIRWVSAGPSAGRVCREYMLDPARFLTTTRSSRGRVASINGQPYISMAAPNVIRRVYMPRSRGQSAASFQSLPIYYLRSRGQTASARVGVIQSVTPEKTTLSCLLCGVQGGEASSLVILQSTLWAEGWILVQVWMCLQA